MDRLSALLMRFGFSTDTFFHGEFHGASRQAARPRVGHLYLVWEGEPTFHHDGAAPLRVEVPTLLLYPQPCAHSLEAPVVPATPAVSTTPATPAAAVRLLCASIALHGEHDAMAGALPPYIAIALARLPALSVTLDLLFEETRRGEPGQKMVLDRLCDILLIQLLRHAVDSKLVPAGAVAALSSAALSKALTAIHDNPGHGWSVETLAAICGMSRSKFARQFHAEVGRTPAEYLTGQRMLRAQSLLRRGMQVQDIALEVGYGSQPAFTRAFRASVSLSPRAWLAQATARDMARDVAHGVQTRAAASRAAGT